MSASADHSEGADAHTSVVTRFAPSPTGFLHIGGARTAVFNWLFAKAHGGKALLRIEDTDKARSTQPAIDAIIDGLDWLGLDWDEPPVFQSERAGRHVEVANELLASGHAYKCFATSEELERMRAEQRATKQPLRYDGRWRERNPAEAPDGAPYVVRLRTEQAGSITIDDAVQGQVSVKNAEIDDYVLLRSDGTPTYMLAVVVDDHDMSVTHLIRGDDHLNNAFRQLSLIHAMGWPEPVYAHIPLIHGNDGAKLSKRHGALGVETYRDEMGVLPDALFNYLLRLGWGYGDSEIISRDEAIKLFSLAGVGKSPSRFDEKKLQNLNSIYLRAHNDADLARLTAPRISQICTEFRPARDMALLEKAMPVLKTRAKNMNELADSASFLFVQRPLYMDEKAASLLENGQAAILNDVHQALTSFEEWELESLENKIKRIAEDKDIGLGKIAQPMRAALTGQANSPGIFDVLVLLGKNESLARIGDQLSN